MLLERADGGRSISTSGKARLEAAFLMVMRGAAENDGYNALTLRGGLAWRDVALIRALSRFLRQIRVPYSQDYMWATLAQARRHRRRSIVELFHARFDPRARRRPRATSRSDDRRARSRTRCRRSRASTRTASCAASSMRCSRRSAPTSISSTRTASRKPVIAIKFESRKLDDLPLPRPLYEIFVYSPRVEGVHLRFGKVARGGIRWSDRPQDFRTEVLGPGEGAAGQERGHRAGRRQGRLRAQADCRRARRARRCRRKASRPTSSSSRRCSTSPTISAGRQHRAARRTWCATTATIPISSSPPTRAPRPSPTSPTRISSRARLLARRCLRLRRLGRLRPQGDGHHRARRLGSGEAAFPRDGHRHPDDAVHRGRRRRHVGRRVRQRHAAVEETTRLVAAFDHRDIFIDPDPDPDSKPSPSASGCSTLPRSSWQDYDKTLISKGGGVYPRASKEIPLIAGGADAARRRRARRRRRS